MLVLLIVCRMTRSVLYRNTAIVASLSLRDLYTGLDHQDAAESRLRFPTDWWGISTPGERISVEQVQICGSIVGVSVRLELKDGMGATELALFNWRHGGSPLRAVSRPDDESLSMTLTFSSFRVTFSPLTS